VGNTPLLAIDFVYEGQPRVVYAKLESLNLTGSIKDRMALYILEAAYRDGRLRPGDRIAEATSGNTGISMAAIGRALRHPVTIFMPDWMSAERIALIRSFGAEIRLVSKEQGGFLGSIALAEELAGRTPRAFLPRQFANEQNSEAHFLTTGREIWSQLQAERVAPDAFVAGVGTGGTITGVAEVLKARNPTVKAIAVEPADSPVLSGGQPGPHKIQGIGAGFVPAVLNTGVIDEIIQVTNDDAIATARQVGRAEGILVGISSGAAVWAALQVARRPENAGKRIVVIIPSNGERYLSTVLYADLA
jgi:cysteine synthase A